MVLGAGVPPVCSTQLACDVVEQCDTHQQDEQRNIIFFFSSRRRHTRYWRDWSSDVCSSDLILDGGRSLWAVADIVAPFRAGPLSLGSRLMDHQEDANLLKSFRNAAISN